MFSLTLKVLLAFLLLLDSSATSADVVASKEFIAEGEQFSRLTFDSKEKERLANETFWGRLYIDSFPDRNGVQYFRAHFGSPPPSNFTTFTLADPITLCGDDLSSDAVASESILVVRRGFCSFSQKTLVAQKMGFRGVLFVNNKDGNVHPSAQDLYDIEMSISMISKNDGERLIAALQSKSSIVGRFVPISCQSLRRDSGVSYCEEARPADAEFVNEITYEGAIKLPNHKSFPYMQAEFGGYFDKEKSWLIVHFENIDFCSKDVNVDSENMKGRAVLVPRGACSFAEKARNLEDLGAGMMVVANDDDSVTDMGVHPDYKQANIRIPSVMITKNAGKSLEVELEENLEIEISFQHA